MAASKDFYRKIARVDFTKADDLKTNDAFYKLFTAHSIDNFKELRYDDVRTANLNKSIPTVLIMHGWTTSDTSPWYEPLKNELLKFAPHNVIYLDWSIAGKKSYPVACANVKPMGKMIAEFFIESEVPPDKIHLVGR